MLRQRSFWNKPEGYFGGALLAFITGVAFVLVALNSTALLVWLQNATNQIFFLLGLGVVVFLALDASFRNLLWYTFRSVSRWITSLFVKIDPIQTLKTYIEHLDQSLTKMKRQVVMLRQEMHKLKELIVTNRRQIEKHLAEASDARQREADTTAQMEIVMRTRKAGRLTDSNVRLEDLYQRMEMMYKVILRIQDNTTLLVEDTKDRVHIKETERKAILASNSAMKSAMDIIRGDKDKTAQFDEALDIMADEVSQKIGEMERFMDLSGKVMQSIDLQERVFEENGMALLDEWEAESKKLLAGNTTTLDLKDAPLQPLPSDKPEPLSHYDDLFK